MEEEHPRNPADLPLVTLDNNALIAVREHEAEAPAVNELLAMNRAALIVINITLSTGLEAGRGGNRIDWPEQITWLESLSIARANIFTGPRTIGFRAADAPNTITSSRDYELALNQRMHSIVRPTIPFSWYSYRDHKGASAGVSAEALAEYDFASMHNFIPPKPQHPAMARPSVFDQLSPEQQQQVRQLHKSLRRNWRNAKNDSLGLYNHLTAAAHTTHPEWSVFVTSDGDFLGPTKLDDLRALGFPGEILRPAAAVAFLRGVTGATGTEVSEFRRRR
jgi:hypothetical protein